MMMRALWVGVTLGALLQNPGERQPPAGWRCSPKGWITNGKQTPMQPCHCKRMDDDPQCEGAPTHDQVCKVWCFEESCACPVTCTPAQK
jgi:hypothetical protein